MQEIDQLALGVCNLIHRSGFERQAMQTPRGAHVATFSHFDDVRRDMNAERNVFGNVHFALGNRHGLLQIAALFKKHGITFAAGAVKN